MTRPDLEVNAMILRGKIFGIHPISSHECKVLVEYIKKLEQQLVEAEHPGDAT